MDFKKHVRTVPDFPQEGIMFRDVTTLFNNATVFKKMIDKFEEVWADTKIDAIAGIDARGFIIGGALAYKMKLPFIALRKKGKLPYNTIKEEYKLGDQRIIYTSGSGGIFKAGIPIGKINEINEVDYFSNLSQLTFVKIVSFEKESK